MSALSLEQLASLYYYLKATAVVLTLITGGILAGTFYVERELGKRREVESARVRLEIETAHQQAQAAEQAAGRLRARFAPRGISPEQHAVLLATLKKSIGTILVIYPPDEEAQMFAVKIAAVLSEAEWKITSAGGSPFGPVFGFRIEIRGDDIPPYVVTLEEALKLAFPSERIEKQARAFAGDELVRLTVGMKRRIDSD